MNYTENYHLPQWDETDRILRTDFNRMCADIESGLTESRDAAESVRQTGDNREKRTLDRFCRMAYNHYCIVQDMSPFPRQDGIFCQNFEKDSSGLTGTSLLNGKRFTENFTGELNQDTLVQSCQNIHLMHVVKNNLTACKPMQTSFTPPRSGVVDHYYLQGEYNNSLTQTDFRVLVRLINQDTGGVEGSFIKTLYNSGPSGAFSYLIDNAPLYFLGGAHYMITVDCLDAICNMDAQLSFAGKDVELESFSSGQGSVTAAAALHTPMGGRGGMAVIRCVLGGEGGELNFLWDGEEREPDIRRTVRLGSGWGCHEFIYLRDDEIPEDSAMSLQFTCSQGGSILLHDWGMILL